MKLDIKKLSDELGLSYEIDETQTIRCAYCDCYILRYRPMSVTKTFDDTIFYKTRLSDEEGVLCFNNFKPVYNDESNYNFLKNELIKTINKFKLEKIEKRKSDLCKDFY